MNSGEYSTATALLGGNTHRQVGIRVVLEAVLRQGRNMILPILLSAYDARRW